MLTDEVVFHISGADAGASANAPHQPERSPSRAMMPNCLQDLTDAAGDRGRVGNPRLLGRSEKSYNQPSQSSATTPWKQCW